MSPLLRGSLVAAVLAVSFAAGYVLKPVPVIPSAVAQAPAPSPPPADVPLILPPMDEVKPAAADVDPNDPTLRMIRDSLGIKTTVLDKNEPLPAVLTDAVKDPVPMGGPMPRLDPPPAPVLPMIDPSPVRRPEPAPGASVRITIRDAGGHVTTLTTTGRVTIDLIGPDGTMPEPGPMPHVVGESVSCAAPLNLMPARPFDGSLAQPRTTAQELILYLHTEDIEDNEGSGVWYAVHGKRYSRDELEQKKRSFFSGPRDHRQTLDQPTIIRYRRFEETAHYRNLLELGAKTTAICSGGRSLMTLFADTDWKPTTATADSCRWEPSPPAGGPTVDGATDIVIPGRPPASTVARTAFEAP